MKKFEHGGNIYNIDIKYDFSANINPLGMSESVRKAVIESVGNCDKYPEPYSESLVLAIAEYEGVPEEKIVCGNGASDLIYRIVSVLKPKRALITAPTFSEYEKALKENNCKICRYFLNPENDFLLDKNFAYEIDKDIDIIIMGNPNNPTGVTVNPEVIKSITDNNNIYFLCDECFLDFVRDGSELSALNFMNERVIILKAFTKIYAMAGLRLGYAIFGDSETAERVKYRGQCWSVSVPAQIAGVTALKEAEYINKTIEIIESERKFLTENLKKLNIRVFESKANFILFYSEIPLDRLLLKRGILIRNCENFEGLGRGYFRIAVRSHGDNEVLIKNLRECLNGKVDNDTGNDVGGRKEPDSDGIVQDIQTGRI